MTDATAGRPHGLFPERTAEEVSRHEFFKDLKDHVVRQFKPRIRARFDAELAPRFRARAGREPATADEVAALVESDPAYRWYSALARAQHELYIDATGECVERQADALRDRCAAQRAQETRGTLTLDPALQLPDYQGEVDIHCVPGGYFTELMPDDVYAAARYELGISLYTLGRHGLLNDSKGRTGVALLRERYPDLAPRRILDLGCTCGNSTLPYAQAWPQAEVHGLDLSAPALRYAHARASALGCSVHFRQANAERTPYEAGSFDLVVSHILLHEVSATALRAIFAESYRLLAPGGVMLHIDVPVRNRDLEPFDQFMADWETFNNNEPFWHGLHAMDLPAAAVAAGFPAANVIDEYFEAGHVAFINSRPWWVFGARRPGARS